MARRRSSAGRSFGNYPISGDTGAAVNCGDGAADMQPMSRSWQRPHIETLLDSVSADGGWGYRPGLRSSAEPTALGCLALEAWQVAPARWQRGLDTLTQLQDSDGGVRVVADVPERNWATGLAVLAWLGAGPESQHRFASPVQRAFSWLINARGQPLPEAPDVFGHDTSLEGWAWVDGTHSWVEPTAYALLALRAAGFSEHPRVREGVQLLLDRTLPDGGWNYGNTRVLGNTLRPFPLTTGIVLTALAGQRRETRIDASLRYLSDALTSLRSPMSIAWTLIGLGAWDARPPDAGERLARCAAQTEYPLLTTERALLLLADAVSPFPSFETTSAHHG